MSGLNSTNSECINKVITLPELDDMAGYETFKQAVIDGRETIKNCGTRETREQDKKYYYNLVNARFQNSPAASTLSTETKEVRTHEIYDAAFGCNDSDTKSNNDLYKIFPIFGIAAGAVIPFMEGEALFSLALLGPTGIGLAAGLTLGGICYYYNKKWDQKCHAEMPASPVD